MNKRNLAQGPANQGGSCANAKEPSPASILLRGNANHDAEMKETQIIYRAVQSLTKRFGAGFTPAGVLVGALGEVLAEEKYDLDLLPPKTGTFDAIDCEGRKVQIRCNQQNTTPIKKAAPGQMLLVLKLLPDGTIEEVFNGPVFMALVLEGGKQTDRKGSVDLSHNKLRTLNKSVPDGKRVPLRK